MLPLLFFGMAITLPCIIVREFPIVETIIFMVCLILSAVLLSDTEDKT